MREYYHDVREEGEEYFWYRGLLSPIYENPKWQPMAINMLARNGEEARKIGMGWNSVTHRLKGVWLQGTVGGYYDYLARQVQAEISEDDHQV